MKPSFTKLLIEQHHAIAALEAAMDRLFTAEKMLIAENPKLPEATRAHGQDAALELVQLVVDQKLKRLTATADNNAARSDSPTPPAG